MAVEPEEVAPGQSVPEPLPDLGAGVVGKAAGPHPGGQVKHGFSIQAFRMLAFATWLNTVIFTIHATQLLGSPLYFINRDYYYAYMALTKQSFGILIITLTAWFTPTVVRVSGDESVRGQLTQSVDGRLHTEFPERLVMIANHQIYTDWLYLWWIAYTSSMHGHIYIILKESLKYIPFAGPGMMFYGFIFLARSFAKDKSRLQHRLQVLSKGNHRGPLSGSQHLDPMWLLIFPEGTNLSDNTQNESGVWAEKQGIKNLRHLLLPRITGLQFCLQELRGTVDWLYDCTVAYEGIPRGAYGQDLFTLRSTFFQGRPPKSVNMYWRRFAISSIPLDDSKKFEAWMLDQWRIKDELLEQYIGNGRFPADDGQDQGINAKPISNSNVKAATGAGFIETEVKLAHWYEIGQIFVVLAAFGLVSNVGSKIWNMVLYGSLT